VWQKIRSIWTYAYDHYLQEYDFFYICGDDVYVAVENLRVYLQGPQVRRLQEGYIDSISSHPWYLHRAQVTAQLRPRPLVLATPRLWEGDPVIEGGGGYILNRAALSVWGTKGADSFETILVDPKEDFLFAKFMARQSIFISDTRDEKGGCRFCNAAEFSYNFDGKSDPILQPKKLHEWFGFKMLGGMDHVSEYQISFHLKHEKRRLLSLNENNNIAKLIIRYHALLYELC
jgi:glycoprotein-N-acetylgalactosamine 3-beta-galactosyltransferase